MSNNVKKLRMKLGFSQKQFAEKVNVSQQEIQRIEVGKLAKLPMANAICEALEKPINAVFPGADKALAALISETESSRYLPTDSWAKLREIGLEADLRSFLLKILFRGHKEFMFVDIAARDFDRVFRAIQSEGDSGSEFSLVVFDSGDYRVAINLRATMFCHFLWEPYMDTVIKIAEDLDAEDVCVYFGENPEPVVIEAEPEYADGEHDETDYLNFIFNMLENESFYARYHIVDSDGESAFLRAADITLLKVPLWTLDPDERVECEEDDEGEGEEGGVEK